MTTSAPPPPLPLHSVTCRNTGMTAPENSLLYGGIFVILLPLMVFLAYVDRGLRTAKRKRREKYEHRMQEDLSERLAMIE